MEEKKPRGLTIEGRDRDTDLNNLTAAWVKSLQWEDCEYGAWSNDPKRPFGNSGDDQIADDILEIIGLNLKTQICPHCREELPSDDAKRAREYAHDLFAAIPERLIKLVAPIGC